MATARTKQQTHTKRVEQIAEEAAAKIAADSPFDEDIIVTVEEVPPTATRQRNDNAAAMAEPFLDSQFAPTRYVDTLAAIGAANAEYVQRIVGAQLRFVGRLAETVALRSLSTPRFDSLRSTGGTPDL
jgi:hypothetical protein